MNYGQQWTLKTKKASRSCENDWLVCFYKGISVNIFHWLDAYTQIKAQYPVLICSIVCIVYTA